MKEKVSLDSIRDEKMYQRGQTPRRSTQSQLPSTPSLRPSSSLSTRSQTPSSISRLQQPRFAQDRVFSPVKERLSRPNSAMSHSSLSSRPATPSFNSSAQVYTGSISVSIRAKPSETFLKDPWLLSDDTIQHNDIGEFKFDHVFDPSTSNEEVYGKVVKNLIVSLMDGFNATVFAYGMTGSGKTYSMSGDEKSPGVIPLSIREIFDKVEKSDKAIYSYDLKVSYLEIYNERIHDLLNPSQLKASNQPLGSSSIQPPELKIREIPNYGVKVIGLTEETVKTENEVLSIIQRGDVNRRTGETDFNTRSSRSHAIVMIKVTASNIVTGTETFSTLSLCDLAGSERATGQQERRKEGSFINKSLLALSSVIVKLSSSTQSSGHINYRDSKLTRLLQPALSGESVVSILCTIHTSNVALTETVNTVRFAARAKNINLTVKRQEVDLTNEKDRMIEKLKIQLEKHQNELEKLKLCPPNLNLGAISENQTNGLDDEIREQTAQLAAENRIMVEQLEHYKRLIDDKHAEKIILKNDIVNDIVTTNSELGPELIFKIEELFKKTYSEVDEFKSYIGHLEFQLKQEVVKTQLSKRQKTEEHLFSPSKAVTDQSDIDIIMREQEDEILELKAELKDKEKIIKALQSARRVRDGLMATINLNDTRRESGRHETLKQLNGEKVQNNKI